MSEPIFKNMNNKDGISLIALIITIIVIIILAAIVVGSALNTPERANWAKFTSDYSNIQEAINIKQTELYGKYATGQMETEDGRIPTRAEIYQAIAKGELPQSGLANDMNEINFSENTILNINEPKYVGKWFLNSNGKLSYEGYEYNGTTWTSPTEEGQITEEMLTANGSYNAAAGVNIPKLSAGMIPIYYDETAKVWKKADATNADGKWYEYTTSAKRYANICTVSDTKASYRTAAVNEVIPISDMTTMFVWIPRYAYSINAGGYKISNIESPTTTNGKAAKINVTFLVGTTNQDKDGEIYAKDYNAEGVTKGNPTPKIVHPGFTFGRRELYGIWIAKFEASGKDSQGRYVGNPDTRTWEETFPPDASTHVQILPGAISWRYTSIGESQYRSMQMASNKLAYGWVNVNTHLIKDSEWGAAAYLSYSQYGQVPMINAAGSLNSTSSWYYDIYTGAGPNSASSEGRYENYAETTGTKAYNQSIGIYASTTGNVYGIYDMSGGAWEYVAVYLDNKNTNLTTYGKSATTPVIAYFTGAELNAGYTEYWDRYEVSSEERNNQIDVGDGVIKTQADLDKLDATTVNWNEARWRLTEYTYRNLPKGIGVSEMSENFSYYGVYKSGETTYARQWRIKTGDSDVAGSATSWNSDYIRIGHASYPFVLRGGHCNSGVSAGVLYTYIGTGRVYNNYAFRPVLVGLQM